MDGFKVISNLLVWLQTLEHIGVYRGHADASWSITPSAFRKDARGMTTKEQLNRWRGVASRYANPQPRHDVEWMVLAQHYGIDTPLLDWTSNPLIALFFACYGNKGEEETDGCVIHCRRSHFKQFNKPETVTMFKMDRNEPGLIDASSMNARTLAQDSVMSIHTKNTSTLQEEILEVSRFVVRHKDKARVLARLRTFGLTPERMFSDLTTAALSFREALDDDFVFGTEAEE